ncbi:class I SAM-dependent methyltransferase [Candidatus Lucifugimonas marina]|uniref:class I SAM-dependent methyltransferase n=1 Tax=Candidatus Lucifugimonas marina TaxID=3038979 RepID=UPI00319DEC99
MTSSEDFFRSSASYYTDYRKPLPNQLFSLIREKFKLTGDGSLVDIGCGTGQLALPLRGDFRTIVGVDLSEVMIESAWQRATELKASNAEFLVMPGEEIDSLPESFDLVTFGSSIHWMDISKTLTASYKLLKDDGGVAIIGMRSIWGGSDEWEQAVVRVVQKWMGTERRAGSSTFQISTKTDVTFEESLELAGFSVFSSGVVDASYSVDIPFIIGHLYTTSYCNRDLLGENVNAFEGELTDELLRLD